MVVNNIHLGKEIQKKLEEHERSATWLAKKLHYAEKSIYKILSKSDLTTDMVRKISNVLKFNFFCLYTETENRQNNPEVS